MKSESSGIVRYLKTILPFTSKKRLAYLIAEKYIDKFQCNFPSHNRDEKVNILIKLYRTF